VLILDEREREIVAGCERAVLRLGENLGDPEISCLVVDGTTLRNLAHIARLRLIFEIPRDHGGIAWRAVERAEPQLVEDVRSDPDYLTSDESITSEVAMPVRVGDEVVAVLDVEFPGRVFGDDDVARIRDEAARLAHDLRPYAP
jgi:GAF domain-containing protein